MIITNTNIQLIIIQDCENEPDRGLPILAWKYCEEGRYVLPVSLIPLSVPYAVYSNASERWRTPTGANGFGMESLLNYFDSSRKQQSC